MSPVPPRLHLFFLATPTRLFLVSQLLDCSTYRDVFSISRSLGDLSRGMVPRMTAMMTAVMPPMVTWVPTVVMVVMPVVLWRGNPRDVRMVRWIVAPIGNIDSRGGFLSC